MKTELQPATAAATSGQAAKDKSKVEDAAKEFEALLIARMLQSVRESSLGGWSNEKDQTGAVALEMAETHMAKMLASNGGLGIARSMLQSLQRPEAAKPGS